MTGSICNNNKDVNFNEETKTFLNQSKRFNDCEIVVVAAAAADRNVNQKGCSTIFLHCCDIILSSLIIGPCIIGFWRGLWMLMDIYQIYFPIWESSILGIFVSFIFCLIQDYLSEIINNNRQLSKCSYMITTRIYLYVFIFFNIMTWRGAWTILDTHLHFDTTSVENNNYMRAKYIIIILIVALSIMILTKTVGNICGAPFTVALDRKDDIFTVTTRFKRKMDDRLSLYVLDCLFSVLIIGTLVVFVWRGAWALLDIYLFPDDEIISAWSSLIVGYTTVIITFTLQPLMKWLCDRINGLLRLLIADFFLIFSLIGTMNVWRGIWMLLDLYLLPDNKELSCWLTHWICLIILILLGCSNSLLVRGVYIDCEEPAGQCVIFPCYYLRIILEKQQQQQSNENNKTELITIKTNETNHIINVVNDESITTTINHDNSHCKEKV